MYDLITKEFKSAKFNSLIWNNKVCWLSVEVAELFGYAHKRKAIFDCIKRDKFEEGIEYSTLAGEELKEFKEVFSEILGELKFAPKIVLFYETGLYGFLAYTEMPLGVEFRRWIGREVMPTLREKGYYVMEGVNLSTPHIQKSETVHNDSSYDKFSTEKMERYRLAFETAKMFESTLDKITKDPVYKFLCLKKIFGDAGIELPPFIDEELM